MGDKVKHFDDAKKVFENKISNMKKVLAQRVKDFDDVKIKLSRRTDKFKTYFANIEKENALLKSQMASQNFTLLQKENNDLRTSYNVLKEKYENSCAKLEKPNNELKMHYKILFDSIKQKNVDSQVFTKSIPKVNVSEKIYTGKFSKLFSRKVSQFTTYSLQKDRTYLKKQHSSKTSDSQNLVKNESSKQAWKSEENISKWFKYSRDEMFSMRKRDDSVLKRVKDIRTGIDLPWSLPPNLAKLGLVRRDDDQIYKFKESGFKRLRLQDIEDMLLLLEHCHQEASGRPSTGSGKLPKEAQPYEARHNKDKKNRLMRIDELYKFSDGTLNDVRNALDDRLKGIRMQYLPSTIWRRGDKERAAAMIQAIDKMLKTRRIMRSLEKFVGGRLYEGDFRMLQRTI
nr:outer membrane protein porin [Tanacetum cinerariifolium]